MKWLVIPHRDLTTRALWMLSTCDHLKGAVFVANGINATIKAELVGRLTAIGLTVEPVAPTDTSFVATYLVDLTEAEAAKFKLFNHDDFLIKHEPRAEVQ